MTRVDPVPRVLIDGQEVLTTPGATRSFGQAVLDDVSATWGRDRLVDNHDAQQGRFTVYDATGAWAGKDLIGGAVVFDWTDPATSTSRIFFRGRIADQTMLPTRPSPSGRLRGATHEFSCVGTLAELGNRLTGQEEWPAENGAARMGRLSALAAPVLTGGIDYRDYWDGAPMAARSVSNTSVLSLLTSMYDTAGGDRLNYDPQSNNIGHVSRQGHITTSRRASLTRDLTVYPGGVFVRAVYADPTPPPMLDGLEMEGAGALTRGIEARLTRVDATYDDPSTGAGTVTVADPDTSEAARGRRSMKLSTELASSAWAAVAAGDWLAIVTHEGAKLAPEPVTYRADRFGGFPSLEIARLLIGGAEKSGGHVVYVAGTPWPRLGVPPCFGIIGGTIVHRGGGWVPEINLAPVNYIIATDPARIRANQLKLLSGSTPFRLSELSRSVKWSDFRYVSP